jgi:hypothetical protein
MATLSAQLSSRLLKYLHKHPDVTQKSVAEYLDLSPNYLSEVISGKKNLNGLAAMKLSQLLEKPTVKADLTVKRFTVQGKPATSHLEHFSGTDDSWTPGSVGTDPNVADFVEAIAQLNPLTRKEVIGAIAKKFPNPTAPNDPSKKLLQKIRNR